jgi:hypothetical protein
MTRWSRPPTAPALFFELSNRSFIAPSIGFGGGTPAEHSENEGTLPGRAVRFSPLFFPIFSGNYVMLPLSF